VKLATALKDKHTKVGENTRLTVKVENVAEGGLPMVTAAIGIPSGLSAQPWQLKELVEKKQVDFYEIKKNYLFLYYRQMKPGESKTVHLDLKSEISGEYQAPASCAYLYYTNEFKSWASGEQVAIK